MGKIIRNNIDYSASRRGIANEIEYNNSNTGFTATNVQDAIDELDDLMIVLTGNLEANKYNNTGGNLTGDLTVNKNNSAITSNATSGVPKVSVKNTHNEIGFYIDSAGVNRGIYDFTNSNWILVKDSNNRVSIDNKFPITSTFGQTVSNLNDLVNLTCNDNGACAGTINISTDFGFGTGWRRIRCTNQNPANNGSYNIVLEILMTEGDGNIRYARINGKSTDNYYIEENTYLLKSNGATYLSGKLTRDGGGAWINDRDQVALSCKGTQSGYRPVIGQKTSLGHWSIGNLNGQETLSFAYTTDSDYDAGNNNYKQVQLKNETGTIAFLSDIPAVPSIVQKSTNSGTSVTLTVPAASGTIDRKSIFFYGNGNNNPYIGTLVYTSNSVKFAVTPSTFTFTGTVSGSTLTLSGLPSWDAIIFMAHGFTIS